MADRVFPNNTNVDMGSKISFSGIDWSSVEQNMQKNKYASSQDEQIKHLLKMAEMAEGMSDYADYAEEEEEEEEMVEAMNDYAEDCEADTKEEEEYEEEYEEEGKDELEHRMKGANTNKAMRKIAFTHPNQISAEAIEAAQAAGDTALVNTILAARKANRQRIASAIETKMTKEAHIAKRMAQRAAIVRMAEDSNEDMTEESFETKSCEELKSLIDAQGGREKAMQSLVDAYDMKCGNDVDVEVDVMAFTSPTKFSKAQREAFNKVAFSLGMPKEYVDSMCAPVVSKEVEALANEVKEVMATSVSKNTKQSLVKSLLKEAKLSQDSKSEFIDYWNNVLGYQDKDFWPMVAADYDNGKRVN